MEMRRIFVSMDMQADINWIITELKSVKDPNLIEALKNLLVYRKRKEQTDAELSPMSIKEMEERLKQSEADIDEGRVFTTDEVKKRLNIT
jgi:hypothetical protein